jgi:hypothetical protein
MLSAKANLSPAQVKTLLVCSADIVGTDSIPRLNAGRAVQYASLGYTTCPAGTFTETFNHSPDYTNNWIKSAQWGNTAFTYTPGNLELWADRYGGNPASGLYFESRKVFTGDLDWSVQLNHGGWGRVWVWLISASDSNHNVAQFALDTDDTNYLEMATEGGGSTQYKYLGTPYMNRWVTLRMKVAGSQVQFFADGALLETMVFTPTTNEYVLGFGVANAPWKSGPNDSSFRSVTATGTVVRERPSP